MIKIFIELQKKKKQKKLGNKFFEINLENWNFLKILFNNLKKKKKISESFKKTF